jgi:pilus assembly protein CpaC
MRRTASRRALSGLAAALALTGAAAAQPVPFADPSRPQPPVLLEMRPSRLSLEAGQGRIAVLGGNAASLFTADPRVAEVRPASPTSVFLFGVGPGRTTIAAMDEAGRPLAQWEVTVRPSSVVTGELQASLRRNFPNSPVRIEMGATGVVLTGEVTSAAEAERAVGVLRTRLDERTTIENRLVVRAPQQVNLRVRIAEISREVTRQLAVNWEAMSSFGRFGVAFATGNFAFDRTAPTDRLLGSYRGAADINGIIDALAQDRLITILAEPNLTAVSGETASFLAGGEFPIPVSQREQQVTIEFKQFGVSLAFVPTVMTDGRISLRVRPEVSELSEQYSVRLLGGNNNAVQIPGLSVRRAETTVELGSGQSFAIAGLLSDTSRQTGRGLPQLGELPVLGALFRSDRFQRNETELVIIITPYLVRPASTPRALGVPTDFYQPPNDVERILLMRQVARGVPAPRPLPGTPGFIVE